MDDERTEPGQARRVARQRSPLATAAWSLALVAFGAGGAVLAMQSGWLGQRPALRTSPSAVEAPTAVVPGPTAPPASASSAGDQVEVVLTPEAVERAGIRTAMVTTAEGGSSVTVPGTVMANAYREVKVTPVAGGIVTKVHAELGSAVKRGAPLVTLFSAELADVQTKFLSMAAMLEADHRKLVRTRELAELGAASRQELEEVTAVHAAHATELEAARQRLMLLGLSAEQIQGLTSPNDVVSTVVVTAPIDGVITGRTSNLGQVVGVGQELFVVTDLSEVWAVGDLYEQDFASVRVGSEATLTTPAYPGIRLRGRVAYIDPRVDAATRTAKVRVEVPNPDGRLRLGMYLSIAFITREGQRAVLVPRAAVQTLGERQVVYLPVKGEEGKFVQRTVQLGGQAGEGYVVLNGLKAGEVVVTEGSFFLRAEAVRNAPSG